MGASPAVSAALAAALAAGAAPLLPSEVLEVGEGKPFLRIEEAAAAARPGDLIRIHPLPGGRPYRRPALLVRTPRLTFQGVRGENGARPVLDGEGFVYSGAGPVPRAIFQFDPGADGCVLEGLELRQAHNHQSNGAGVRVNQANDLLVRDCEIHHNDMGVMSNGSVAARTARNLRLESCRIHHNGSDLNPGYNHNLYLGGTSAILRGCEVFGSTTGHNVKSRAHYNRIEACFVHDAANREFDLVDAPGNTDVEGSHAVLLGNVIVKAGPPVMKGNRAVLHFGQDGGGDHRGTIHLVHNTIVTPYLSPVVELSAAGAEARLINNLLWDAGAGRKGQVLVAARAGAALEKAAGAGNWLIGGFGLPGGTFRAAENVVVVSGGEAIFVDPARGDYRLRPDAARKLARNVLLPARIPLPAAPGGEPPPTAAALPQYRAPLGMEPRPDAARPAAGACGPAR